MTMAPSSSSTHSSGSSAPSALGPIALLETPAGIGSGWSTSRPAAPGLTTTKRAAPDEARTTKVGCNLDALSVVSEQTLGAAGVRSAVELDDVGSETQKC